MHRDRGMEIAADAAHASADSTPVRLRRLIVWLETMRWRPMLTSTKVTHKLGFFFLNEFLHFQHVLYLYCNYHVPRSLILLYFQ